MEIEMQYQEPDHIATYSEAFAEYAQNAGSERVDVAWILTPWDTWEHNPHYVGAPVPHPETEDAETEELYAANFQESALASTDVDEYHF